MSFNNDSQVSYEVYGEKAGWIDSFATIREAKQLIKELYTSNSDDVYYIYKNDEEYYKEALENFYE